MKGIITVILFSLLLMLPGCAKAFSNNSMESQSNGIDDSEKKSPDISSYENNYLSKVDNNIKILFASQENYYISQGYI